MVRTGSRLALPAAVVCISGVASMRDSVPYRQHHPSIDMLKVSTLKSTLFDFDRRFAVDVDLGYMSWFMNCTGVSRSRSSVGDVEVEEVRFGLGADADWQLPEATPALLQPLGNIRQTLPRMLAFSRMEEGVGYFSRPPHVLPSIAGPYVASKRYDLSKVDFIFGGSLLDTLATGDFGGKDYTVQRWRGAVMIRGFSRKAQFIDLKDKNFQVERLVTGKRLDDFVSSESTVQHLQVLRIGTFKVLLIGKADAVDQSGRLVEITTVFEPNWRKIMFSMLAKGSTTLVRGIVEEKWPNEYLNELGEYSLRHLISWTATDSARRELAANILHSLKVIRDRVLNASVPDKDLFQMNETTFFISPKTFWSHTPQLYPLHSTNRSLLPKSSVLSVLFPPTAADDNGMGSS